MQSFPSVSSKESIINAIKFLNSIGVPENELIIIGGTVLELYDLREANDIDFAVSPKAYKILLNNLENDGGRIVNGRIEYDFYLSSDERSNKIDVKKNTYENLGITDSLLFSDNSLTLDVDSFRFARLELEFGRNLFNKSIKNQRWAKDRIMMQRYALNNPDWRWDLIPVRPVNKTKKHYKPIYKRPKDFLLKCFKVLTRPIASFQFLKKRFVNRFYSSKEPIKLNPTDLSISVVDLGTLIQWQFYQKFFCRYDTLLRSYVFKLWQDEVLNTEKKTINSCELKEAFSYYEKMQEERVNRFTKVQFEELMNSIQRKGFQTDKFPLKIDQNGRLIDGSHRLSCALNLGLETVPVKFELKKKGPINYGRNWFEKRGFPEDLLMKLDIQLNEYIITTGAAFILILWPPAQQFTAEVKELITSRYHLIGEALNKEINNFPEFVEKIYLSDDIDQWKIQKKSYHMKDYPPIISAFAFQIDNPAYRAKFQTESYLSESVENLKKEIRSKYRDKVENYVHDIIVHIGDNPSMNRDMIKCLNNHGVKLFNEQ